MILIFSPPQVLSTLGYSSKFSPGTGVFRKSSFQKSSGKGACKESPFLPESMIPDFVGVVALGICSTPPIKFSTRCTPSQPSSPASDWLLGVWLLSFKYESSSPVVLAWLLFACVSSEPFFFLASSLISNPREKGDKERSSSEVMRLLSETLPSSAPPPASPKSARIDSDKPGGVGSPGGGRKFGGSFGGCPA